MGSEISLAGYGSFFDSAAQGGPPGIFSTFPANSTAIEQGSEFPPELPCLGCRTVFGGDTRYAYLMGTSMAAPQVAGVAALVRRLNPDLGAAEVIRVLKQTASRPAGSGWSSDLGWGILDAGAAVDAARAIDAHRPVSRASAPRTTRHSIITLTWRGSDPAPPGVVASGIARFEVFRITGSGRPVRLAVLPASRSSLRVRVSPGKTYGWLTIAVDRAGNRELKTTAEVHTRTARGRRAGRAGGSSSAPRRA
jgi:hypothetical protein